MELKEIDEKLAELKTLRHQVEKKEIEDFKIAAQANVGRCFIIDEKEYAKVIGVPQEYNTKTGIEFNRYQYPAFFIKDLNLPRSLYEFPNLIGPFFEYDTLFSGAWGEGRGFGLEVNSYIDVKDVFGILAVLKSVDIW